MITDAYFDPLANASPLGLALILIGIGLLFLRSPSTRLSSGFALTRADLDPLYNSYMHSPEWRAKRIQCLRAANNTCANAWCRRRYPDYFLRAHHGTYDRLYHELPEDLKCLCLPCHQLEHPYRVVS